jgi:hypothetical protein
MTNDNEASISATATVARISARSASLRSAGSAEACVTRMRLRKTVDSRHLQRCEDRSAHKRANYAYTLARAKSWPALSRNSLSRAVLASLA